VKCPECNTWVSVKETRSRPANAVYRRYECANEHRFTTLETVVRVIKPKEKEDEEK
jgi:transcriptional regulator NrdR family protein